MKNLLIISFLLLLGLNGFGQDTFSYADTIFKVGSIHRTAMFQYGTCMTYGPDPNDVIVDSIFSFLNKNPKISIEVGCHTDERGSASYNLKLSERRAQIIVSQLTKKGIDSTRLKAAGYGESQPIFSSTNISSLSDNDEKERLHAINRRNELKIISIEE